MISVADDLPGLIVYLSHHYSRRSPRITEPISACTPNCSQPSVILNKRIYRHLESYSCLSRKPIDAQLDHISVIYLRHGKSIIFSKNHDCSLGISYGPHYLSLIISETIHI